MFNSRWCHPSSLQSGTFDILQVPNLCFLNQIMSDQSKFQLPTWYMMSKMTPSLKSPVRSPQRPPSPQLKLSQPNPVQSWSNFQDRPLSNYQSDLWCQRWPHPSSLQSGTFNILQVPNSYFLSQIMSDLDQTFRIGPIPITIIIFYVQLKMTPSFKSPAWNPQRPRSPQLTLSQWNQVQYWSNIQDRPLGNKPT